MTTPALAGPPRARFIDVGRFGEARVQATAQQAESAARGLVSARVPSHIELGKAAQARLSSGERAVRLPQVHRGLEVVTRGASVTFAASGQARLVGAHLEDTLPDDVEPAFGASEAAAKAAAFVGLPLGQARLAIWPGPDGGQLVYVVSGRPSDALPIAPVVIVDARSGEVLVRFDAATALNKAKVYPTNPKKSPELAEVTLSITEGETRLINEFVEARNCIDEKEVKDISFSGFNLKAHVCALKPVAKPDANGDYLIEPGEDTAPEDPFAELSIYHHTNRMLERFKSYSPDLVVQQGAIVAVANLRIPQGFSNFDLAKIGDPDLPLTPFQNAFFAPNNPLFSQIFGIDGGAMWFGQGPKRDYAYDGDVVYHEFTHAVVNATIQLVGTPHRDQYGVSVSPGGMNEGLADYFSSALAGDGDVGEYASTDFASGQKAIRSLTSADSCPKSISGEVHQDATLFSGSLWDVRSTLGADDQDKLDRAVFSAMTSAPSGDLGYEELATLIVEATAAGLSQEVADQLTKAFEARGVLPGCTRIIEINDKVATGPSALLGAWVSLGTSTTGITKTFNPGVVQFRKAVEPGTTRVRVSFKKSSVGSSFGGANNPLGGGTPASYVVALNAGAPITFNVKPFKPVDTLLTADAEANTNKELAPDLDKTAFVAFFDLPEGTTEVYAMIGNKGQADGAFTTVNIVADSPAGGEGGAAGEAGAGGEGGEGGQAGSGQAGAPAAGTGGAGQGGSGGAGLAGTGPAAAPAAPASDDGGCGCRAAGAPPASPAWLALGLLALRRRRR